MADVAKPVTPELAAAYRRCFQDHNDGLMVFDDLLERFGGQCFVPGHPDVTTHRLGAKGVVEHILTAIEASK